MKTFVMSCALSLALTLPLIPVQSGTAAAAEKSPEYAKIDPATYICAELTAQLSTSQTPPIFESLQIDGYAAADGGVPLADPAILGALVLRVGELCTDQPTYNVLPLWHEARRGVVLNENAAWPPESITCKEYKDKEAEQGNAFLIWLDAYNRRQSETDKSVLDDDAALKKMEEFCAKEPDSRMLDALKKALK